MRTIQENWDSFQEKVVPKDAGPHQITETRNAFYAGAMVMFSSMTDLGDRALSDPARMGILNGYVEEIDGYAKGVFKSAGK